MKKDTKVKILLLILLIMVCVSCKGQVSYPNQFIGRWEGSLRYRSNYNSVYELFEFFADGTLLLYDRESSTEYFGYAVEWRVINNRLIIKVGSYGKAFNYQFSSNTLILTDDDGTKVTLTKKE